MRVIQSSCLIILISNIYGNIIHDFESKNSQLREQRQTNIYEFLRHVLSTSPLVYGFPPNNYGPTIRVPVEFINHPYYKQSTEQQKVVVNVNHPESKPTTIINNVQAAFPNFCPCERYVRSHINAQLECLCPMKQIFVKCTEENICVPRNFCENGLVSHKQYTTQFAYNRQSDLCDESTHTCCLPVTEEKNSNFGEGPSIYNHFVNSSVDQLNNTVTKYFITGNVYLNNGNPTMQFETEYKVKVHNPTDSKLDTNLISNQRNAVTQETQILGEDANKFPALIQDDSKPLYLSSAGVNLNISSQKMDLVGPQPSFLDVPATTETLIEFKIEKNPANITETQNVDITTYRPKINANVITSTSLPDILDTSEIDTIFGTLSNVGEESVFPGLQTQNRNTINGTIGTAVIVPSEDNSNSNLPQLGQKAPENKFGVYLSGRVEKLRNFNKTNATTGFLGRVTKGVGTRIFVEATNNNEITTEILQMYPPTNNPSQFSSVVKSPSSTTSISTGCPSAMKCVQSMYCTPEGLVSTVPVILTKEEEVRKNLLLNCGDESTGQIGKCCFDRNT